MKVKVQHIHWLGDGEYSCEFDIPRYYGDFIMLFKGILSATKVQG